MLKHILTGQPSSTGSRHHHNDYQTSSGSLHGGHQHHHHMHNNSLHQQEQQTQPQQQAQPQQQQQQQQHHHYTGSGTTRGGSHRANNGGGGVDVYDSAAPRSATTNAHHQTATTPSSAHRHPLNHSQLSVNNLSQRLNHSHALNLSTLSTSKHSVNSVSPIGGTNGTSGNNGNNTSGSNNGNNHNASQFGHAVIPQTVTSHQDRPKANGGFDISRLSRLPSQTTPSPAPPVPSTLPVVAGQVAGGPTLIPLNTSWSSSLSRNLHRNDESEVKETMSGLGLLCLVSVLLAVLSVIFLLKVSPATVTSNSLIGPEEFVIVYEITLSLCILALSLDLCCVLVCIIQFLFASKLVRPPYQGYRSNKYLQKSSISRVCAVGGFFISIPVFLSGLILYTFIHFHTTPAIVTSVLIGLGIVFCGCAVVHNVFVWQKEKTNAVKAFAREQCEAAAAQLQRQQQQLQLQHQPSHQQSAHPQHQQHQLHHQQQQQQQLPHHHHHHHHQPQQLQLRSTLTHASSKMGGSGLMTHSTASLAQSGRGIHHSYQHHPHQHYSQRNAASMSPSLLLSSPQATLQHNHSLAHRITSAATTAATPPTTPGDRSPPSPGGGGGGGGGGKLNRSQHLTRETSGSVSPGLPAATLDLSSAANTNSPHELSTLV